MTKKELEEKLKNIPKDEYIYQRYDGRIHKFLKGKHWMIDTETGINIPEETMLLGKVSENIIDLIEEDDIVNGFKILEVHEPYPPFNEKILDIGYGMAIFEDSIKTILTKEQYEANCYKVKEE